MTAAMVNIFTMATKKKLNNSLVSSRTKFVFGTMILLGTAVLPRSFVPSINFARPLMNELLRFLYCHGNNVFHSNGTTFVPRMSFLNCKQERYSNDVKIVAHTMMYLL